MSKKLIMIIVMHICALCVEIKNTYYIPYFIYLLHIWFIIFIILLYFIHMPNT